MANAVVETPEIKEQLSVFKGVEDLSSIMQVARGIQDKCVDFSITDSGEPYYSQDLNFYFTPNGHKMQHFPMSDHAFSQLCGKIGVPVRYMKKCLNEGEVELVSDNINAWLDKFDKPLFIRTYNDKIRGVLSDKFSVLDVPDVLDVLYGNLPSSFGVKSYYLNEERFHARLIQKDLLKIPGEDLFAGIQIDTSDVGRSILLVRFMIYKQVCTNGLTISKGGGVLFEQRHIGINTDEFSRGLSDNLKRLPDLVAGVTEAIVASKKTRLLDSTIEPMIKHFRETLNVPEDTSNRVISLMDEKYGRNHWGLINGITEVAQQYTLERRLELEKYAGSLLMVA